MSVEQELSDAVFTVFDSEDTDRVAAIFKAEQGYYTVNTGMIWEIGLDDGIDWNRPYTVRGYDDAMKTLKDVIKREWKS